MVIGHGAFGYTAISRKVVGESARDKPERYCGWFWADCFSKKFKRMAGEAVDICLRVLKESNESRFDSYSVRNSVLIISQNTFRDCSVHSFSDNLSGNNCMLNQCSLVLYAAVLCVVTQSCNRSLFLPFCGEKRYVTTERPGVKGNRNNFDTVWPGL